MSVELPPPLRNRRDQTDATFRELRTRIERTDAPALIGDGAAVYVTGSYGRGEASQLSDLDAFIVFAAEPSSPDWADGVKTILARVTADLKIPEFTDEGKYLSPHAIHDLVEKLGGREDDYANLFTARMLLLLESKPLLGENVYSQAIDSVIGEYWRDYHDNAAEFLPIYLTNDIIRYWKVLCLNYEERTKDRELGKRHLHNYKLKHSRLLTCYSAILWLGALLRTRRTITPEDARRMTSLSPIDRLRELPDLVEGGIVDLEKSIRSILDAYARFLEVTAADKNELRERFADPEYYRARKEEAREFGSGIFDLLRAVVEPTQLFRFLLV